MALVNVCLAASCIAMGLAYADDYADVNRMQKAGQLAEANAKVDQFLATKPRDAQMRFLKGVILIELRMPNDAISAFTKLTENFPELRGTTQAPGLAAIADPKVTAGPTASLAVIQE